MVSDEERRHAAAELRTAADGEFRHVDVLDVIAGSIGVDVSGMYTHEAESKVYAVLADFVDRPAWRTIAKDMAMRLVGFFAIAMAFFMSGALLAGLARLAAEAIR